MKWYEYIIEMVTTDISGVYTFSAIAWQSDTMNTEKKNGRRIERHVCSQQ